MDVQHRLGPVVHHIRSVPRRVALPAQSSIDGFDCVRASRARSTGATFGARAAHSASDSSSASFGPPTPTAPRSDPPRAPPPRPPATTPTPAPSPPSHAPSAPTRHHDPPSRSIWPRSSSTRDDRRAPRTAPRRCTAHQTRARRAPTAPSASTATRRDDRRRRTLHRSNHGGMTLKRVRRVPTYIARIFAGCDEEPHRCSSTTCQSKVGLRGTRRATRSSHRSVSCWA